MAAPVNKIPSLTYTLKQPWTFSSSCSQEKIFTMNLRKLSKS
jgi:hypothetical protein